MKKIINFLEENNLKFKDIKYYNVAFTHMSYVHESKIFGVDSYERLEFLGDSILGHIISEYVYKNFLEYSSGDLTLLRSNLVRKEFLAKVGKKLKFEDYIKLGQGEKNSKISNSVYEDVYESLVAALYLDLGFKETEKFVNNTIIPFLKEVKIEDLKDYKTKLQEFLQSESGKSATYKTFNQKRVNNEMVFYVQVLFDGNILGTGKGKSKKTAEQLAAKEAYKKMVK